MIILSLTFYKNNTKFKFFSFFILFLFLFSFTANSNADSNGVWHKAEDIRGGVFGGDEQDISSGYSFINLVTFNDDIMVSSIRDKFNNSYYLNPSSSSNLNKIDVSELTVNGVQITTNGGSSYWDPVTDGVSNSRNRVYSNYGFFGLLYDKDDTSYYLNPSSSSNLNRINIMGGNVVNNCIVLSNSNISLLSCSSNMVLINSIFNSTSSQWDITCCYNNN